LKQVYANCKTKTKLYKKEAIDKKKVTVNTTNI